MKKKVFIIIFILVISITFIIKRTLGTSELTQINTAFIYDEKNLKENLTSYIDLIDDSIIPQSSYIYSNTLSENYDFLVNFAIAHILKYREYYSDIIITGKNYQYIKNGITYVTNEYVKKEDIYKITNDVFGKEYYYIINEQLKDDNLIMLLLLDDKEFKMKIDKITNIIKIGNLYEVYVKYQDVDFDYIYLFSKEQDRLILKDLSIGE